MAWCFSTKPSVAAVLSTQPCISSCLWVNACWDSTGSWNHSLFEDTGGRFMLHIHHHDCRCPADIRSQGISSHDIDLILLEYPTFQHQKGEQNGWHFADNIFNAIFLTVNICLFVDQNFIDVCAWGPILNKSTFIQIMAWFWRYNNTLLELMMTQFINAYMCHWVSVG